MRQGVKADGRVMGRWGQLRAAGFSLIGVAVLGGTMLPLAGCGNFFQCENKPACPASTGTSTSTGTSSSVDYAYVAYSTATSSSTTATLVGYNLAGGALTQVASVSLPFIPVAIAVSPNNEFLYVASIPGTTNGGVYGYAISSTGSLTALSNGAVLANDTVGAMTISPDGEYLYTLNALQAQTMFQYTFTSTGTLNQPGDIPVPSLQCSIGVAVPATQSCSVAVSPNKNYVMASVNTQGDAVYSYASGQGITSTTPLAQIPAGTNSGDFSVAIDGNNNAYVAQTASLTVFGLTSSAATTKQTVAYASGDIPRSVVVDPGSKFVFTANEGTSKISAFTTGTNPSLAAVSGSPFPAPASVAALGVDSTDTYLIAAGYDTSAGIQLYSIASSGVLSALAKTAGTTTSTQYPVLVAMSH